MWDTVRNNLYVSYWAQGPICELPSWTIHIKCNECCEPSRHLCVAGWNGLVECMHCTLSLCRCLFPLGFPVQRFLMAMAQAIPLAIKITPDRRIYVCFESENPLRYPACMFNLICKFCCDATMFERIPLPSELLYNLQHCWGAYVHWGLRADMRGPTYVSIKAGNTVEASILQSRIESRLIYVSINISGLVKLVGWDTL